MIPRLTNKKGQARRKMVEKKGFFHAQGGEEPATALDTEPLCAKKMGLVTRDGQSKTRPGAGVGTEGKKEQNDERAVRK